MQASCSAERARTQNIAQLTGLLKTEQALQIAGKDSSTIQRRIEILQRQLCAKDIQTAQASASAPTQS